MVIISEYDLIAIGDHEFCCESHETRACPCCGGKLRYRDRRRRIMRSYGGKTYHLWLRRLICPECQRLHLELPDVLVPRKHYASEVIENVVDEVSTEEDESTEDYPCEDTMERWKSWLERSQVQIEGWLRSVGERLLELGAELLSTGDHLLRRLRERGAGWLGVCIRVIYNTGGHLPPLTNAPVLLGVPEEP